MFNLAIPFLVPRRVILSEGVYGAKIEPSITISNEFEWIAIPGLSCASIWFDEPTIQLAGGSLSKDDDSRNNHQGMGA
jgi:hypothetical protein